MSVGIVARLRHALLSITAWWLSRKKTTPWPTCWDLQCQTEQIFASEPLTSTKCVESSLSVMELVALTFLWLRLLSTMIFTSFLKDCERHRNTRDAIMIAEGFFAEQMKLSLEYILKPEHKWNTYLFLKITLILYMYFYFLQNLSHYIIWCCFEVGWINIS